MGISVSERHTASIFRVPWRFIHQFLPNYWYLPTRLHIVIHIQEVLSLSLSWHTRCPDLTFSHGFVSPPRQVLEQSLHQAMTTSFKIVPNSRFIILSFLSLYFLWYWKHYKRTHHMKEPRRQQYESSLLWRHPNLKGMLSCLQYGTLWQMGDLRGKSVTISDQWVWLHRYIRFIKMHEWEECFAEALLSRSSDPCLWSQPTAVMRRNIMFISGRCWVWTQTAYLLQTLSMSISITSMDVLLICVCFTEFRPPITWESVTK